MAVVFVSRFDVRGSPRGTLQASLPEESPPWAGPLTTRLGTSGQATFDVALPDGRPVRVELRAQVGVGGFARWHMGGVAVAWTAFAASTSARSKEILTEFRNAMLSDGTIQPHSAANPDAFAGILTAGERPVMFGVSLTDAPTSAALETLELDLAKLILPRTMPGVLAGRPTAPPTELEAAAEKLASNPKVQQWLQLSTADKLKSKPALAAYALVGLMVVKALVTGNAEITEFVPGTNYASAKGFEAWLTLEFHRGPLFGNDTDVKVVFSSGIFGNDGVCTWDYIAQNDVLPQGLGLGFKLNTQTTPDLPPPRGEPIKVKCSLNAEMRDKQRSPSGVDLTAKLYWGGWKQDDYTRVID